jgi:hypothetical protein
MDKRKDVKDLSHALTLAGIEPMEIVCNVLATSTSHKDAAINSHVFAFAVLSRYV